MQTGVVSRLARKIERFQLDCALFPPLNRTSAARKPADWTRIGNAVFHQRALRLPDLWTIRPAQAQFDIRRHACSLAKLLEERP